MRRKAINYLALLGVIVLAGCGGSSSGPAASDPSASVFDGSDSVNELFGTRTTRSSASDVDAASQARVVSALNDFSLSLHHTVANRAPSEDSIESGYSAAVAFSLAYAGTAGATRSALSGLLGIDDISGPELHPSINALTQALESRNNDDLILHTANRIFVREGLNLQNDFLDIATGEYGAPVIEADFVGNNEEATRVINDWVSEQTDGFIPSIVSSVPPQTVFALLNTLFLDATWQDEYRAAGPREFNTIDGNALSVESFTGRSQLPLLRNDDLLALEIPYAGGDIAMLIMVPEALAEFEATLDAATLDTLLTEMSTRDIQFTIPNWEDSAELNLADLLTPSGFPMSPWNFGRMIEGGANLDVIARQKARVEVDENGTRAAAVTLVIGPASVPETVDINRPFVYLIRDRVTGVVLFTGRVVSPG